MAAKRKIEFGDRYVRNADNGKAAKITKFSKPISPEHTYYVALFNKGDLEACSGHYCKLLRHAYGDAEDWCNS